MQFKESFSPNVKKLQEMTDLSIEFAQPCTCFKSDLILSQMEIKMKQLQNDTWSDLQLLLHFPISLQTSVEGECYGVRTLGPADLRRPSKLWGESKVAATGASAGSCSSQ